MNQDWDTKIMRDKEKMDRSGLKRGIEMGMKPLCGSLAAWKDTFIETYILCPLFSSIAVSPMAMARLLRAEIGAKPQLARLSCLSARQCCSCAS